MPTLIVCVGGNRIPLRRHPPRHRSPVDSTLLWVLGTVSWCLSDANQDTQDTQQLDARTRTLNLAHEDDDLNTVRHFSKHDLQHRPVLIH